MEMDSQEAHEARIQAIQAKLNEMTMAPASATPAASTEMATAIQSGIQAYYPGHDATNLKPFDVGAKQLEKIARLALKNPDKACFMSFTPPATAISSRLTRYLDRATFTCMMKMRLHNVAVIKKTKEAWFFIAKTVDGRILTKEITPETGKVINMLWATQRALLEFAREACSPPKVAAIGTDDDVIVPTQAELLHAINASGISMDQLSANSKTSADIVDAEIISESPMEPAIDHKVVQEKMAEEVLAKLTA